MRRGVVPPPARSAYADTYRFGIGPGFALGSCCVTSRRTIQGQTQLEHRYYIASLRQERWGPEQILELIRGHWDVENRLHYVRDVTLQEDLCRVRTGSGPRVFADADLRNVVIALLRNANHTNIVAAVEDLECHPPSAVRLILCEEN